MTTELECGNYKPHRRDAHQNPEADYAKRNNANDEIGGVYVEVQRGAWRQQKPHDQSKHRDHRNTNEMFHQHSCSEAIPLSGVYHFPGPRRYMPDTLPMLHSPDRGTAMPRRKKPPFEFSPEQRAVWRAIPPKKVTVCPKYRRVGVDEFVAHIKRDKCEQCRAFYLQIEREEELIRFLRTSRN
jgi:hypothetical protein